MRRFAVLALGALLASTLSPARASAAGECPDGDWFCDPTPIPDQPEAPEQPDAGASSDSAPDSAAAPADSAPDSAPVTSRRRERQIRIDVERVRPAARRKHRRFREWGVNMHATLGLMAHDAAASGAGMNGLGAALRFRPIPHIAIEGALELVWGTDYNGYDRFEDAVLFSGLFFLNPRSAVQLYGLAGFGLGGAYLDSGGRLRDETYAYVGLQGGVGLEARITRRFAVGGDLIGFVRERNDRNASENPEFVDPVTHRSTNSSGGGLVRLGATFYW